MWYQGSWVVRINGECQVMALVTDWYSIKWVHWQKESLDFSLWISPLPGEIPFMLDVKSPMDLWQVCPMLPLLCYTFSVLKSILFPSHLQHFSICPCSPCFILCSCIPVSLISIPMSPWSSHPSHIVLLPHSCFLFHTSTFVSSPWLSQADPAA